MSKFVKPSQRILIEDALKHIHSCERSQRKPSAQSVAGALQITLDEAASLLASLAARGLLVVKTGDFYLTSAGSEYALQIIRAHRLWERYLADETGFAEGEWHERADRHEHEMSPDEIDALSARLGHPTHDPHGDPIPTAEGEVVSHGGQPLATMQVGDSVQIVHLEDEPAIVYAQLIAEGLYPGLEIRLTEISPHRVCLWADGEKHILAPIVAANISVIPVSATQEEPSVPAERLSGLALGQQRQVVSISPACRGPERRRLMDLGIIPGTTIRAEIRSPSGDPTAYSVRGSLLALRKEQANLIWVSQLSEAA